MILKLVDAEDPPLRIFFGTAGLPMTKTEYAQRLETWEKWNDLSAEAQGNLQAKKAGSIEFVFKSWQHPGG